MPDTSQNAPKTPSPGAYATNAAEIAVVRKVVRLGSKSIL